MILTYKIVISVYKGTIQNLLCDIHEVGCEVYYLNLNETRNDLCEYEIYVKVEGDGSINKLISQINENDNYKNLEISNHLEEQVSKGFIKIKGNLNVETDDDYKVNLLGLYQLYKSKISTAENPLELTNIKKTVAFVSSYKNNRFDAKKASLIYGAEEIDSIILSEFAGFNGFPFNIGYDLKDDFIKLLRSFKNSFGAIRLFDVEDEDDPDFYSQIYDAIDIPVISRKFDETAIMILVEIFKLFIMNKQKMADVNVGFIGLDSGCTRLTSILPSLGCSRVLGCDPVDKSMMFFERHGGLATTLNNIFSNSDVVVLIKDCFEKEDIESLRPGVLVASFIDNPEKEGWLSESKSCRRFIKGEDFDYGALFPGIIKGLVESEKNYLSKKDIVDIAKILSKEDFENDKSPENYLKIQSAITKTLLTHRD